MHGPFMTIAKTKIEENRIVWVVLANVKMDRTMRMLTITTAMCPVPLHKLDPILTKIPASSSRTILLVAIITSHAAEETNKMMRVPAQSATARTSCHF